MADPVVAARCGFGQGGWRVSGEGDRQPWWVVPLPALGDVLGGIRRSDERPHVRLADEAGGPWNRGRRWLRRWWQRRTVPRPDPRRGSPPRSPRSSGGRSPAGSGRGCEPDKSCRAAVHRDRRPGSTRRLSRSATTGSRWRSARRPAQIRMSGRVKQPTGSIEDRPLSASTSRANSRTKPDRATALGGGRGELAEPPSPAAAAAADRPPAPFGPASSAVPSA